MERLTRIAIMVASGNVAPLLYALWVRWKGLEFRGGQFVDSELANEHAHSGGPELVTVLRKLRVPPGSVALDYGVGMGLAAMTMAPYFERVIGIDLSPELIATAHRNIAKVGATNIALRCCDARTFSEIDDVTHVYMFNPFKTPIVRIVMENLQASLERRPRKLTVIYKHPACHEVIPFPLVKKFEPTGSHPFYVYESS